MIPCLFLFVLLRAFLNRFVVDHISVTCLFKMNSHWVGHMTAVCGVCYVDMLYANTTFTNNSIIRTSFDFTTSSRSTTTRKWPDVFLQVFFVLWVIDLLFWKYLWAKPLVTFLAIFVGTLVFIWALFDSVLNDRPPYSGRILEEKPRVAFTWFFARHDDDRNLNRLVSKICWTYHVTYSTHMTTGLLPLTVRPPGTVSRSLVCNLNSKRWFQAPAKDIFVCMVLAH